MLKEKKQKKQKNPSTSKVLYVAKLSFKHRDKLTFLDKQKERVHDHQTCPARNIGGLKHEVKEH